MSQAAEKKTRQAVSDVQRHELRKHAQNNPGLKRPALIQWFQAQFNQSIDPSQVTRILSSKYAYLDTTDTPTPALRKRKRTRASKVSDAVDGPPATTATPTQQTIPKHSARRLLNRACLVTGSSSGLGRAIALLFASHGAKLIVCADLQPEPHIGLDDDVTETHLVIEQLYGAGKALFVPTDVTRAEHVQWAVEVATQMGGRLDVIVNNAGLGVGNMQIRLHELEDEAWDRLTNVNLRGVYLGCKYALRQFLKQEPLETGRRGWIINVSSMLGYVGIAGGAGPYCATKGAVLNLTKQIAIDYAKDRIHCNALCPGFTKTPMTRDIYNDTAIREKRATDTPWGEWANPMDVAKGALFLASDDAAFVTGIGLPVDGGYLAQ